VLNEIGLDPGIDHMSAMRVIHGVGKQGGKITSFRSYCGGFPAPEANTNPWGYKFSWSPKGVLMAGKNEGRFLENGKEVFIPGPDLFAHYKTVDIEDTGAFEGYTNRDCLGYIELYGLKDAQTMFRGTLRYPTWCDNMKKVVDLGLLGDEEKDTAGMTYAQWISGFIPGGPHPDARKALQDHFGLAEDSHVLQKLEWLGLFSDHPLPLEKAAPIDIMTETMVSKMAYEDGERDMIILYHDFLASYSGEKGQERITSTLVDYGIPHGDSAMSRTVSLPAAIATDLILSEKIRLTGVHIPVMPEVYQPVLEALEKVEIICREKTYPAS
jgi:saccharopine dehydrogenase-like NADP-dependent oxidoreductase